MADDDKHSGEETESGFIGRWAKRKQQARLKQDETDTAVAPTADDAKAEPQAGADDGDGPEALDPETLPDPEELPADADWSVYMRQGVPEALQRRALRRLWRLNPVYGHLDRLNDYDDDFTDAATVVQGLKTLYKVGKGMVVDEDDKKPAEAADEPAATEADLADSAADEQSAGESGAPDEASAEPQRIAEEAAPARPLPDVGSALSRQSAEEPAERDGTEENTGPARIGRSGASAAARRWNRFST